MRFDPSRHPLLVRCGEGGGVLLVMIVGDSARDCACCRSAGWRDGRGGLWGG